MRKRYPVAFFAALAMGALPAAAPLTPAPPVHSISVVRQDLLRKINGFPRETGLMADSQVILYQRYPLSGRYPPSAFNAAAPVIERLLSRFGTVREASAGKLDSCLNCGGDSAHACRYAATPCEFTAATSEKNLTVGSFVKLNRQGDFVPTRATRTISSRTTAVTLRFVIVDCWSGKVIFDDREKATVSDDERVQGTLPKGERAGGKELDQATAGAMRAMGKIEAKMKAKIK
jgi:hypothetical protein